MFLLAVGGLACAPPSCVLPTAHGSFDMTLHRVGDVVVPALRTRRAFGHLPLVRVHDACFTSEVFGSRRCDCADQLRRAMDMVQTAPAGGVILHVPNEGRGIGLAAKVRAYDLQDRYGVDTFEANEHLGLAHDGRTYECVPIVLRELGIRGPVTLLTNNAIKRDRLRNVGVDATVTLAVSVPVSVHSRRYMDAKRRHFIDADA